MTPALDGGPGKRCQIWIDALGDGSEQCSDVICVHCRLPCVGWWSVPERRLVGAEALAQLREAPRVERFHRGRGGVEIARHGLDAQVLDVPQHDHRAAARRQLAQRREEGQPQLDITVPHAWLGDLRDRRLSGSPQPPLRQVGVDQHGAGVRGAVVAAAHPGPGHEELGHGDLHQIGKARHSSRRRDGREVSEQIRAVPIPLQGGMITKVDVTFVSGQSPAGAPNLCAGCISPPAVSLG